MIPIIHDRIDSDWKLEPATKNRLVKQLLGKITPRFPAEMLPEVFERASAKSEERPRSEISISYGNASKQGLLEAGNRSESSNGI